MFVLAIDILNEGEINSLVIIDKLTIKLLFVLLDDTEFIVLTLDLNCFRLYDLFGITLIATTP